MDKMTAYGHVDAYLVSPDGGARLVSAGHNTLMYACADAVARLFSGDSSARPTTIGFVTGATNDLAAEFAFSGERDKTQDDVVSSKLTVEDVTISPNPTFAADAGYSGNKVTLSALHAAGDSTTYVYGFLLKDAKGNLLAVRKLDTVITHTTGFGVAASWTVTFA